MGNVFFLSGACRGRQIFVFPQKKPEKFSAPAAQLENKFISFVVHKITFCGFKNPVGRLSGRPHAPDSPTKKNVVLTGGQRDFDFNFLCLLGAHTRACWEFKHVLALFEAFPNNKSVLGVMLCFKLHFWPVAEKTSFGPFYPL